MAERRDDLLAGALQARLRQVVAEQVDRRDQRLRLERQQARRAGEVVAVGVGVDLDPVAVDLGVEDVGAAAEVDDVEDVEVLAQLLDRDVELVDAPAWSAGCPPSRAAPISSPASVTRRAKRSGRITDSERPLEPREPPLRRPCALGERAADGLGDVELRRGGGRAAARAARRPRWRARADRAGARSRARTAPRRSAGARTRTRSRRPSRGPWRRRRARACAASRGGRSRARPARRSARAGRPSRVPLISPICQSARVA